MKINNKGFMLVEVIVVSVVVATIMTSLFIAFERVFNVYDKKSNYTDLDAVYALKMIEDYMIDEIDSEGNVMINKILVDNTYFTKISCDGNKYCDSVFNEYNVNSIYLVKNNEESLIKLKDSVDGSGKYILNETFREYIEYLMNIGIHTRDFLEDNKIYSDLLLIEVYSIDTNVEDDKEILNKYGYLPVLKKNFISHDVPQD